MRVGSLCSGAGGLDMAVEAVFDAHTVWHCEKDAAASKVLAHRYLGVPNHDDLVATDWDAVEPIDILCAGWPCQPFSLAGKQKGAEDERAIWPHIADAVRVLRPRIVVLENVSAVLRIEFGRVANSLAALGYDLRWTCLRASDVGAPHRRERLFVVAHANSIGQRPHQLDLRAWESHADGCRSTNSDRGRLAERTQCDGEPQRSELSASFGRDVDRCGGAAVELFPTPAAARSGRNQSPSPGAAIRPSLDMIGALLPIPRTSDTNGAGAHGDGGPDLRTLVTLLQTPSTADGEGSRKARGGLRSNELLLPGQAVEMATEWGKYAPAIARWETIAGPAPSPTEPNRNGKPRLNPAFSEWMMGWPPGWVTVVPGISRNDQLRIVGNGVVPQCAAAALSHLMAVH